MAAPDACQRRTNPSRLPAPPAGASLAPSYLRVQPNGTVPTLVVGDAAPITESKLIVQHVDTMGEGGELPCGLGHPAACDLHA
jgi:hypothetical protein